MSNLINNIHPKLSNKDPQEIPIELSILIKPLEKLKDSQLSIFRKCINLEIAIVANNLKKNLPINLKIHLKADKNRIKDW